MGQSAGRRASARRAGSAPPCSGSSCARCVRPPPSADQSPLVLGLLVGERMARREDGAELLAEEALAREPGEERSDGAAEETLAERRAGGILDHRAVQQEDAGDLHSSAPSRSRAISSVATEVPMSWATMKTGCRRSPCAADELLDQVGLPVQRVVVVPRLLGEPEAEKVRGEDGVLGLQVEQEAPVIGARREAVQEDQERALGRRARRRGCGGRRTPRPPALAPRRHAGASAQPAQAAAATGSASADDSRGPRPRSSLACSWRRQPCRRLKPLQVPGVELAQVAGGAIRPEVLLGTVDHPEQLARSPRARSGSALGGPSAARRSTGCRASRGRSSPRRRRTPRRRAARPRPCRARRR